MLEAFEMMIEQDGEEKAMERIRQSARRLLTNIFRTGLFENPYLIPEESAAVVGCPEFMKKGYEAQVKSIVMVKNHDSALPLKDATNTRVYIPQRTVPASKAFFGNSVAEKVITPVSDELAGKYFQPVHSAAEADVAIVFIDSPDSGPGYSMVEAQGNTGKESDNYFIPEGSKVSAPGNGYYPISLQYEDYVAEYAREESIGQGDPAEKNPNRSYKGKGVKTFNKSDLELVRKVRSEIGDKKLIVAINSANPTVLSEIEPLADAILITFTIQNQAVLEIVNGKYEPSGLLPFQMPANMKTVELQNEDTPRDMDCYTDCDGNVYDFAYGLNWSGVINDWRVKKYK